MLPDDDAIFHQKQGNEKSLFNQFPTQMKKFWKKKTKDTSRAFKPGFIWF